MLLTPSDARRFMATYEQVAIAVHALQQGEVSDDPRQAIHRARQLLQQDPALLQRAVSWLQQRDQRPDAEVIAALGTLRLDTWVHLKDLRGGSVLLDVEGANAYLVAGLTQPLVAITGRAGVVIEAGLCGFAGRILCDGILIQRGMLGPGLKQSCHSRYRQLKAEGRLHRDQATAPLWSEPDSTELTR